MSARTAAGSEHEGLSVAWRCAEDIPKAGSRRNCIGSSRCRSPWRLAHRRRRLQSKNRIRRPDMPAASNRGTSPRQGGAQTPRSAPMTRSRSKRSNGNEPAIPPPAHSWSFGGIFGHYDTAQLQRGYQVYKEVCSNCHSMKLIAFRNLSTLGYSEGQIKALAATYEVDDGPNDKGKMYKRPGRPADILPVAVPKSGSRCRRLRQSAARTCRTLAKARGWEHGFPTFIGRFLYAEARRRTVRPTSRRVLNGYTKAGRPEIQHLHAEPSVIAMPKPLSDGQVDYSDGSPQTLDQYSSGRLRLPHVGGRAETGRSASRNWPASR